MKNRLIKYVAVAAFMVCGIALANELPVFFKTLNITTQVDLPITSTTGKPIYLTEVSVRYTAPIATNGFSVSLIRSGVTYNLMSTGTQSNIIDVAWYVPGKVFLYEGDVLRFKNDISNAGKVIISAERSE
jgi:hypothetical protein